MRTLTRREAAARLGKSVATIRRLEGTHLTPRLVAGVHRFDPDEVDALRGLRIPEAWGPGSDNGFGRKARRDEALEQESQARRQVEKQRDELRKRLGQVSRELEELRRENTELRAVLGVAMATVNEIATQFE
jgi:hypothetical protein